MKDNVQLVIARLSFFIVASFIIIVPNSYALNIQDYISDSVSGHPQVREQVHIFRQMLQDQKIADSGWRPSIDLEASISRVQGDSSNSTIRLKDYNEDRIELAITQNLFNGYDTTYRVNQTEARMRSALYEVYDTSDNIALDAIQAYLEVLKQQRLLGLALENVASHEDILKKIKKRSSSGAGRRSQLEQTEGRLARAQASWVAQKNNVQDALSSVHEILGRYVTPEELVEPGLPKSPGVDIDLLIDQALEKHPAIIVANYNIDAARNDQLRSKSNRYPKVDLRLAKELSNDLGGIPGDRDDLTLMLNLKYNLYRGGADSSEERKKTSIVHEQQQFKARVRRQIINTLRLAWAADQSLTEQLKYLKQHVVKTRETMVSYQREFFIGQRDLINLLDAKNELNSAQNRYAEAYFDSLDARFRMYESLGGLFDAIQVTTTVGEDDLFIAKIQAKKEDQLPLDPDLDIDKKVDDFDHCDNTRLDNPVNKHGCQQVALNTPPKAVDDEIKLDQNDLLTFLPADLLKNDSDDDGDKFELTAYTQPKNGALAMNDDKSLIYRADENFFGNDKFSYTITDSNGDVSTARVNVVVSEVKKISLTKVLYVNFEFGGTVLTKASLGRLEFIVEQLKKQPVATVDIFAYTDSLGSKKYNLKLSQERASAVRKLIINKGIAGGRVQAFGRGESEPVADNETKEGQAINRRGEFHFSTKVNDFKEQRQ